MLVRCQTAWTMVSLLRFSNANLSRLTTLMSSCHYNKSLSRYVFSDKSLSLSDLSLLQGVAIAFLLPLYFNMTILSLTLFWVHIKNKDDVWGIVTQICDTFKIMKWWYIDRDVSKKVSNHSGTNPFLYSFHLPWCTIYGMMILRISRKRLREIGLWVSRVEKSLVDECIARPELEPELEGTSDVVNV